MSSSTTFSPAITALIAGLEKLPASFTLRRTQYIFSDDGKPTKSAATRGMIWFTNKRAEACEVFEDRACEPGTICLIEAVAFRERKKADGYRPAGRALGLTGDEIDAVVRVADSGRNAIKLMKESDRKLYRAFNDALRRRAKRLGISYVA